MSTTHDTTLGLDVHDIGRTKLADAEYADKILNSMLEATAPVLYDQTEPRHLQRTAR